MPPIGPGCFFGNVQHIFSKAVAEHMLYERILRPLLFRVDPEWAHHISTKTLTSGWTRWLFSLNHSLHASKKPNLATELCGIPLENPIGLAAGFDKSADLFPYLHRLGFGFIEIGTVTAHAQPGNERPRLFRLPADQALINRMGFNNDGAETAALRLRRSRAHIPLGGNIGKSKVTKLDDAVRDYEHSFLQLRPYVDYFVINVSSPNTPQLRELQSKKRLRELLSHLSSLNERPAVPMLLKIAPDLNQPQLEEMIEVVEESAINGIIATNTTISREGLASGSERVERAGAGGLSGAPLTTKSTEIIRFLRRHLPKRVQIVGVGGVFSGAQALEKILAGACCLQIYTGLIYRGPNTVFKIASELERCLGQRGFTSLKEAIGAGL